MQPLRLFIIKFKFKIMHLNKMNGLRSIILKRCKVYKVFSLFNKIITLFRQKILLAYYTYLVDLSLRFRYVTIKIQVLWYIAR